MFRKLVAMVLLLSMLTGMAACATHNHRIGAGGATNQVEEARQWYILWGLVPLNDVDTQQMAGGAESYDVKTERTFLDIVMNLFTGLITVNSRTVVVTK